MWERHEAGYGWFGDLSSEGCPALGDAGCKLKTRRGDTQLGRPALFHV
jgi:hypothetical protein